MHSPLLLALFLSLSFGNAGAQTPVASDSAAQETVQATTDSTQAEADADALYGEQPVTAAGQAPGTEASQGEAPSPVAGQTLPQDPRTQAEDDFNALYGTQQYDPLADPTLPAPYIEPSSYDPWEKLNRRVHRFNNAVDRTIATPLAKAYIAVVPRPLRLGVGNFFSNLGQPVSALNALLQGKPKQAGQSVARFAVNATLGLGGFFDPATKLKLPNRSEDFGQTLGVWGWKKSRYVELPLFGPRTVRDVFGLVADGQLSPIRTIEEDKVRVFTQGLQLVDVRTQLMSVDAMREGATDEYALFRDAMPGLHAATSRMISSSTAPKSFSRTTSLRLMKRTALPSLAGSKKEYCCW
ncbi:MAG: VacJ family lipoprotein [Luteimonas sp.]